MTKPSSRLFPEAMDYNKFVSVSERILVDVKLWWTPSDSPELSVLASGRSLALDYEVSDRPRHVFDSHDVIIRNSQLRTEMPAWY
jgi:hypothetical protein